MLHLPGDDVATGSPGYVLIVVFETLRVALFGVFGAGGPDAPYTGADRGITNAGVCQGEVLQGRGECSVGHRVETARC